MSRRKRPAQVRWPEAVESAQQLDPAIDAIRPYAERLIADPTRRSLLHGHWLGHGIHPMLTDIPLGFWTSGTVLDLFGGPDARPAAKKLIGLGILSARPTAVTGLAEWAAIGRRDQRTGVVHAAANSTALLLYVSSWMAHRKSTTRGTKRAVAGGLAAIVGGYLGGHLTEVRKISSRHPDFAGTD
jgi:hypothetical protein